MPSHAYMYASADRPDWKSEDPLNDTEAGAARRRELADAILLAVPCLEEASADWERGRPWISLHCESFEVTVYRQFLHIRLRWRSHREMAELRTVENLHRLQRAVDDAAGFDVFEHGCQGLHRPGDIDAVPDAIAGFTWRLRDVFGVDQEQPVSHGRSRW